MTGPPAETAAPLNVFQRLIRHWEQVHPYNGGQAMAIAGEPDLRACEQVWNDLLRDLGLGMLHVDSRSYHYNGMAAGARQVLPALHRGTTLAGHLSDELNRTFADGEFPFRPFVLREPGRYWLGVTYRHLAADSVSVRMILREWFVRLLDPDRRRPKTDPLSLDREGYWNCFGPSRGRWDLLDGLFSLPRTFSRFRQVRKVRAAQTKDLRNVFAVREASPGLVGPLREAARRRGATLHDLFLAAAAKACEAHLPLRDVPRRRDLAIGTIVDLRPYASVDLSETFGLFLGFTNVFCRPDDLRDPERLVATIAAQTRHQKACRAPASGIVWMYTSLMMRRVIRAQRSYRFHRKHMPITAGVSNVALDRTWAADYHPTPLLDFVRTSPTGPMAPLVFTPTTLGDRLTLGFTYRPAVVPADAAHAAGAAFVDHLTRLI